jgi:hypothetical protein
METLKLTLAALLMAPITSMAAVSSPNLAGTYSQGADTLTISQTNDAKGNLTYRFQSRSGGTVTMTVGSKQTKNGAMGPVEEIVSSENNQLILTSTLTALGGIQKTVSSLDKDGNLVDQKIISAPGMPEQIRTTVYPRKN